MPNWIRCTYKYHPFYVCGIFVEYSTNQTKDNPQLCGKHGGNKRSLVEVKTIPLLRMGDILRYEKYRKVKEAQKDKENERIKSDV